MYCRERNAALDAYASLDGQQGGGGGGTRKRALPSPLPK